MMRHPDHARLSSRGAFRVTAVVVVAVAAGVTAGSAPAATQQPDSLTLQYSCAFPSGSQPVSVQVAATYPAAAKTGQRIQPAGARITVSLPHAAVARLRRPEGGKLTLTAELGTVVSNGKTQAMAVWRNFTSPATAIPRNGPLSVTTAGAAPSFTPVAAGAVTVNADGLLLAFRAPLAASSPPASTPEASSPAISSTPAAPGSVRADCAPRAGQGTTLAKVAVTGPAPAKSAGHPAAKHKYCQPFPKNLKLNPLFPLPKPLPGSNATRQPQTGCSYAVGFTNAKKLNEAALVGPGLTDLRVGYVTYTKFPPKVPYSYFYQKVPAQLQYHGQAELPPARATLLAFGFMPVSATLQISELGSLNAALVSCAPAKKNAKCPPQAPNEALFFGRVTLRISDVAINGVPLNVGAHCQTATPFNLELAGHPPSYNISAINGILTGTVTVPQFAGCANGSDNLDPVFDATVSGPGNFVKINQAPFCTPINDFGCPPVIPKPKH